MNKEETVDNKEALTNEESAENQAEQNQEEKEGNPSADKAENSEEVDELTQMKEELAVWKDKFVRLHAEFDNFRKRNARERVDLIQNASQEVIAEILPVLDDFDRAIKANAENDDITTVKSGFELIHNKLFRILESKGLKPMDSMGKEFNTDHHEAITQIPAPEKKLKGKVVDVIESGYLLNDHVLRYAKVVVGQ